MNIIKLIFTFFTLTAAEYMSSKALFPYQAARLYCTELGWKLARGGSSSAKHIDDVAWVRGPVTRKIPTGKALLYKKANGTCCYVTRLTSKCRSSICDHLAPALCHRE